MNVTVDFILPTDTEIKTATLMQLRFYAKQLQVQQKAKDAKTGKSKDKSKAQLMADCLAAINTLQVVNDISPVPAVNFVQAVPQLNASYTPLWTKLETDAWEIPIPRYPRSRTVNHLNACAALPVLKPAQDNLEVTARVMDEMDAEAKAEQAKFNPADLPWLDFVRLGKSGVKALARSYGIAIAWDGPEIRDRRGKFSYFRFCSVVRRAIKAQFATNNSEISGN